MTYRLRRNYPFGIGANNDKIPRTMNSAAATQRIAFMLIRCASASPIHTAGTFAIIMPRVVPITTATSESYRAASAMVAS